MLHTWSMSNGSSRKTRPSSIKLPESYKKHRCSARTIRSLSSHEASTEVSGSGARRPRCLLLGAVGAAESLASCVQMSSTR